MDKLAPEKRAVLTKTSIEWLHTKLVKASYDEHTVAEMEHNDLLNYYAEYLLSLPADPGEAVGGMAVAGVGGGMSAEEFKFW